MSKKRLKIPNRYSEAVNKRKTNNLMPKIKGQTDKQ